MTKGMIWTALITALVLLTGVLIGHAHHAQNEQVKNFNMECIQAGGTMEVHKDIEKVFCQKNKN